MHSILGFVMRASTGAWDQARSDNTLVDAIRRQGGGGKWPSYLRYDGRNGVVDAPTTKLFLCWNSCAAMLRRHGLFLCRGTLFPFGAQKNVPAHFFVFDKNGPKPDHSRFLLRNRFVPREKGVRIPLGDTNPAVFGTPPF
jgi:hypothetical protein